MRTFVSFCVIFVLSVGAYAAPTADADHPTLSQMWTATVSEPEVGTVIEMENFVSDHEVKPGNPSAKWTNYTDGSCQRLIYQPYGNSDLATRYLLKCDSVDCCTEDGNGPQEYQIPNVHPFARVISTGAHDINLFDGETVRADGWSWKFMIENFSAYTTKSNNSEYATLVQWVVNVQGQDYTSQYVNYTIIPDSQREVWAANFQVPNQCKAPNTPTCGNLYKAGKLSDKSMRFLRSGKNPGFVQKAVIGIN